MFKFSLKSNYEKDGLPIRCPHCHSKSFSEDVVASIDGYLSPACEIEYICDKCSRVIAYWAYGGFDPCFQISDRSVVAMWNRFLYTIHDSWDEFLKDVDLRDDPLRRLYYDNTPITRQRDL